MTVVLLVLLGLVLGLGLLVVVGVVVLLVAIKHESSPLTTPLLS